MKAEPRRVQSPAQWPAVSTVLRLELGSPAWPVTCSLFCAPFGTCVMPHSVSASVTKDRWWLRPDLCRHKMASARKCGLGCVPAQASFSVHTLSAVDLATPSSTHVPNCPEQSQLPGMVAGPRTSGHAGSGSHSGTSQGLYCVDMK